jgi:hypothetical protein
MRKDISPLVSDLRTKVAYLTTLCSDVRFMKMNKAVYVEGPFVYLGIVVVIVVFSFCAGCSLCVL